MGSCPGPSIVASDLEPEYQATLAVRGEPCAVKREHLVLSASSPSHKSQKGRLMRESGRNLPPGPL